MRLLTVALAGLLACSRGAAHDAPGQAAAPAATPTPASTPAAAPASPRTAPGGGTLTATDGKPVEVASLYQGHCAVLTFYRGFF
jgi:hypothetical protein